MQPKRLFSAIARIQIFERVYEDDVNYLTIKLQVVARGNGNLSLAHKIMTMT